MKVEYITKLSEQELFDKVATHLLSQGVRCTMDGTINGDCAYRNSAGMMCAAGCLVPDEDYDISMEGWNWAHFIEMGVIPTTHGELIEELQEVHDSVKPVGWREALTKIAVGREYSTDAIDNVG